MGKSISEYSTSVIIPAYNAEKTIVRALNSVLNQTEKKYIKEIYVINDGSTDNTKKIVEDYINTHLWMDIFLINKKNGGVSSARNEGLRLASGNWIALLDSDDEWYPEKLEKQFDIIEHNPDIDFLGCNHTNRDIKIFWKKINKLYRPSIKELCIKMFPQTSTVVFKRRIIDEIGYYDENRKYCEDGHFFMRICVSFGYYYMPEQLVEFDNGKRGFGVDGLSSHLKEMQEGLINNFKELRQNHIIDKKFYFWLYIYSQVKYLRRILICMVEKK